MLQGYKLWILARTPECCRYGAFPNFYKNLSRKIYSNLDSALRQGHTADAEYYE